MIFQETHTIDTKKPYNFNPCPPPPLWIRACIVFVLSYRGSVSCTCVVLFHSFESTNIPTYLMPRGGGGGGEGILSFLCITFPHFFQLTYKHSFRSRTENGAHLEQVAFHNFFFFFQLLKQNIMLKLIDKKVSQLKLFYCSTAIYVMGTQKNRFIETVLLSNQNRCINGWMRSNHKIFKTFLLVNQNICFGYSKEPSH